MTTNKNDDPRLPDKTYFRIDEVADYFCVSGRTVRRWIEKGHLVCEKVVGCARITRQAILDCPIRKK